MKSDTLCVCGHRKSRHTMTSESGKGKTACSVLMNRRSAGFMADDCMKFKAKRRAK